MKKIIAAAIGGVAAAGLIVLASPNASAGPNASDLTPTQAEIDWVVEHGKSEVCALFGANPTSDGFTQTITNIMEQGWEVKSAARIFGHSVGILCPEHLGAVVEATIS